MNYGQILREKREYLGVSRYRLSKLSGIPESTLKTWEDNERRPPIDGYAKALEAMGESLVIGKQGGVECKR